MAFRFGQRRVTDPLAQQNFEQLEGELDGIRGATGSFCAYRTAALNVVNGSFIIFDTVEFDTSDWYDTATGKFTPQVAGIYRLDAQIRGAPTSNTYYNPVIRKNGTTDRYGPQNYSISGAGAAAHFSTLVEANGSTDYFQVLVVTNSVSSPLTVGVGARYNRFEGELVGRT